MNALLLGRSTSPRTLQTARRLVPSLRVRTLVTLYDYETRLPGKSISPASMKVRLALNYKRIPHRTSWMKFHEIEERARELGLPANITEPKPDGTFKFTIPIIEDATTEEAVSDSIRIVDYLDRTYPSTPRLIVPGTEVLLAALHDTVLTSVSQHLYAPVAARVVLAMDDFSAAEYRLRVERVLGQSIEEFLGDASLEDGYWIEAERGFDRLNEYFVKANLVATFPGSSIGDPFTGGQQLTYGDLILAAPIFWVQRALGEDHPRWKQLASWNGGRWAKLYDNLKAYSNVD